ncbi:TPA: hypothetical protein IU012_000923 [Enterococcus faecalis]|uniref:hypothetical protein n=1 Tax=Enterococcus faecalis TaxID=1351 RepID=UPI0019293B11|nr:hypothetical protein [Enterococcus faecalis]UNQ06382.1 hypothetical protein MKI49_002181 [Enterococcus faecalis]UNQ09437.1 hypothetical protein MKI56_002274 [Enterococcus faecalis]HAP5444273.1 hypothetical protein [Enterococcus faecalis]HDL6563948.1 hypothetical protein [Enterococcus faecalis]HDL6575187.1 hypothetical protein [Enterococcus faecalis]
MAEERIKRIADGIYKEVGGQENVDGVCQYSCRIFIFHLSKSRTSLWSVGLVIQ